VYQFLKECLENYGYIFLFIWTFLEGEAGLILAGFYAFEGTLGLPGVIATALAGSFLGDQFYFHLGRRRGRCILAMFSSVERRLRRALALMEKYGAFAAFISRYTYGLRIVLPIILGMTNLSKRKFFVLNLASAFTWAVIFSLAGYLFGKSAALLIDDLDRYESYLPLCLLFLIGCIWLGHFLHFRWLAARGRRNRVKSEVSGIPAAAASNPEPVCVKDGGDEHP